MKLVSIVKSTDKKHKYVATFENPETGRTKTTRFGAVGYKDYTSFSPTERNQHRKNYRQRHSNDNLHDPTSAGALSWYILWGANTSVRENIASYKRHFHL